VSVEAVREVGRKGGGREDRKEKKGREKEKREKNGGQKGKWSNRGLGKLVFGQNGRR
jgi:hypothetical protein